jgi:large subunit ribosomal protein L29e
MNACAEVIKALEKPKAVKPKMPKGPSHKLSHLAFVTDSTPRRQILFCMARSCRLCQAKSKLKPRLQP